jgi:hypothetical protein
MSNIDILSTMTTKDIIMRCLAMCDEALEFNKDNSSIVEDIKLDIYIYERVIDELDRLEALEKENQELKDKNTKMFVELSNTITAINKFLNYLDKDKTKTIAKYSIKETFFKIVDKVVEE